jgi:hypothetical protein
MALGIEKHSSTLWIDSCGGHGLRDSQSLRLKRYEAFEPGADVWFDHVDKPSPRTLLHRLPLATSQNRDLSGPSHVAFG